MHRCRMPRRNVRNRGHVPACAFGSILRHQCLLLPGELSVEQHRQPADAAARRGGRPRRRLLRAHLGQRHR